MIGALDQPEVRRSGGAAAQRIPGAKKIVYAKAGHMINMERSKKSNRDLGRFLASLRAR